MTSFPFTRFLVPSSLLFSRISNRSRTVGIVQNPIHPSEIRPDFQLVGIKKLACQFRTWKLSVISHSKAYFFQCICCKHYIDSFLFRWHIRIFAFFIYFIDPFTDASKGVDESSKQDQPIHIRIQQRSGRKTLTTVQGIVEYYDKKKLVKAFKKVRICSYSSDLSTVNLPGVAFSVLTLAVKWTVKQHTLIVELWAAAKWIWIFSYFVASFGTFHR